MSGASFTRKLLELGILGADKLDPSDYDWLFLHQKETTPLVCFLQWFIDHVHSGDVLTTEELRQYQDLLANGKVLTGQQLDDIASSLATLPSDDILSPAADTAFDQNDISYQLDVDYLETQLEKLNLRKDQLGLHKLELRSEIFNMKERTKLNEASLCKEQQMAMTASAAHEKALVQLANVVNDMALFFNKFNHNGDIIFLSQLDLKEWHEEEQKFQSTLRNYINKQFKDGVKEVAGQDDINEYQLLEAGNLDLQLVRGADQEEYKLNVCELQRLSQMMELSEHEKVKAEIKLTCKKVEVEEAERFMNRLSRSQLPSLLQLLQMNISELKESRRLVQKELKQQMENILDLSSLVSQSETTHTISGNYQVKLQRQEYFLKKQNFVIDQLTAQLNRYNWLSIAFDLEENIINDALSILCSVNTLLCVSNTNHDKRMLILKEIQEIHQQAEVLGHLSEPFATLKKLVDSHQQHIDDDQDQNQALLDNIKSLDSSISSIKHQLDTIRDPHGTRLRKMDLKCKLLEECLFGGSGVLTTLPVSWLGDDLVERQNKIHENAWKFKQGMLGVIQKHVEKKKILEVDPSLERESLSWIKKFANLHS